MTENKSVSKNLYKIFIITIKYIPIVLAILKIIGLILSYLKMTSFFLTCLGGTSILFLIILYILSHLFNFCGTHRLSLHYVTITYLTSLFDYYIGIPLSTTNIFVLYLIITGLFMLGCIIYWFTHKDNPKINHVKELCDKFIDCRCK